MTLQDGDTILAMILKGSGYYDILLFSFHEEKHYVLCVVFLFGKGRQH